MSSRNPETVDTSTRTQAHPEEYTAFIDFTVLYRNASPFFTHLFNDFNAAGVFLACAEDAVFLSCFLLSMQPHAGHYRLV